MQKRVKRSPALAAIANGNIDQLRKILDAGASPSEANEVGYTLLIGASATGKQDFVQLLIERGANVNAQASREVSSVRGVSALIMAVRNGFDAIARMLVRAGADVNAESTWGETPLYEAICRGNESLVRFLIKHGAKPTLPVPFVAIKNRYSGIFKLLLEAGANVEWRESKTKQTLLGEAVDRGNHAAFVEPLLLRLAQ
jgi:uncharacterized protein